MRLQLGPLQTMTRKFVSFVMTDSFSLGELGLKEKVYTLEEARQMLPWIKEATQEADTAMRQAKASLTDLVAFRKRAHQIIQHWAETVFKLGALPKQPFTVDFNSGTDYLCWEFPEDDIYYRHDYDRGYAGRHPIEGDS